MSRRKDAWTWVLVVGVVLLIVGAALYIMWPQLQPHATVHLGDGVFTTRVAKTPEDRDKGFSGFYKLNQDQALLLVYDTDSKWKIDMKNTSFPIDIVWLDKDKKVVYIVKNAPPESYPYEQFESKEDARYILEVAAGTVQQSKISIGATAQFDENNLEGLGQ